MRLSSTSSYEKLPKRIRYINKSVFNHLTLIFVEYKGGPISKLIHKGSKSGRIYKTPDGATYLDDKLIIPLTYGDQADWLRDILAEGSCEIIYRKSKWEAIIPEVISSNTAFEILPEKRRRIFERYKLDKFSCMQIRNETFREKVVARKEQSDERIACKD